MAIHSEPIDTLLDRQNSPATSENLRNDVECAAPAVEPILDEAAGGFRRAVQALLQVEERNIEPQAKETYLRTLLDTVPAGILVVDAETRRILDLNRHALQLSGRTVEELVGCVCNTVVCPAKENACPILDLGQTVDQSERVLLNGQGEKVPILKSVVPGMRDGRKVLVESFVDISSLKQAQAQTLAAHAELAEAQKRMIELSRLSGMAEVATGVLHNVGNVLNSVNVSANVVVDHLRASRVTQLGQVVSMLREHEANILDFLSSNPRGQRILPYLEKLARNLAEERDKLVGESQELVRHVGHIKEIVAMQQNYACAAGVLEKVSPAAILEDSLRITEAARERHGIRIELDIEKLPTITTDRNRILQIVVNLLRNAKEAVKAGGNNPRRIMVRQRRVGSDRMQIQVIDNGVGIAPENLTRIFSHGFTTKRDGHGFGLHSGALAAQQLGGSLKAESDGPGRGATFTLDLPLQFIPPAEGAAR